MKTALFIFTILLVYAGNAQNTDDFQWLIGTWERTQSRPGTTAVEIWSQEPDGSLVGMGITMKGIDTVFIERLSIVVKNNKTYYVADVSHNTAPTYFEITQQDDSGFTSENPEHDFPKKIVYKKEGDSLTAIISGNGKQIPFYFRRID